MYDDDDFRLFRISEVCRITTLSRSSIFRLRKKPDSGFPAAFPLTSGRIAIRRSELASWLRTRH